MTAKPALAPVTSVAGAGQVADTTEADELATLLVRGSRGDQTAFAELYDRTSSSLYGLILRVLRDPAQASEVTQDVYLEIWQQAARFDRAKGTARSWMFTIAHRRAVDRVRSAESAGARDLKYGAKMATEAPDVSEEVVDNLEAQRVRRAMATLTDVQRDAIELAYFGGYTHTELAQMLKIPLGTAKTRIRDGLIRLRDALGGGK